MTARLTPDLVLPDTVAAPAYDPVAHGVGIVHLGVGAFHRAHQAVYTDDALAQAVAGDWRIVGVSLRGTAVADALNPQGGRYTLLTRGIDGNRARVVASIDRVIAATRDRAAVLAALADSATCIVSLTVTEKAYGIDRATGAVDPRHDAIAADLAAPRDPVGAVAMVTEGLRRRHAAGLPPFTVLCCDNLPRNGALLRDGVLDFARRVDPALADWIAAEASFPSTMVDRITPAPPPELAGEVAAIIGADDAAAVAAEEFTQWVIEDRFTQGRPDWQAGGALFVTDVTPFEDMKLRMLNGAHSLLAYAGHLSGCTYVRDAMAVPSLRRLVGQYMTAAATTLEPTPGIDLADYAGALDRRFCNPAIAHATYQIAMDGTEKLPQRIVAPALVAQQRGADLGLFAFATAAWMRYALGRDEQGTAYDLRDPRAAEITAAMAGATTADAIAAALMSLPALFPPELADDARWRAAVGGHLTVMLDRGMAAAVDAAAAPD